MRKLIIVAVVIGLTTGSALSAERGTMEKFGSVVDQKIDSAKEFFGDSAVTARIKKRFIEDKQIPGKDVKVSVDNGVATLEGDVESEAVAQRAIDVAKATEGVKSVENKMMIISKSPSQSK